MMLLSADSPPARAARQRVAASLSRFGELARDEQAPAELRLATIAFMGHTDYALSGKTLEALLTPQRPSLIQVAAARALSQLPGPEAPARLIDRWRAFTPEVREAALSALLANERQIPALLSALENGSIPVTALGPSRRSRLVNHRSGAIQARARAVFAVVDSGDRIRAYEQLRAKVLARSGVAASGKQVFALRCASCHAVDGTGGQVAPELRGMHNQPADAILLHTLVPDYEITPGYQAYVVETRDGRTIVGRIESEAPNSLTLRDAASQPHVILRSQATSIVASPTSLMPGELERVLSEQDLADLIAYLKSAPARRGVGRR
jgi:putative heme-binding domain-containing protein